MHTVVQVLEKKNEDGSMTVTVIRDDGETASWRCHNADDARRNAIEAVLRK